MISPYLPLPFNNYPTLTIIADCCHVQTARFPVIANHLTGMVSPYLPPSFSNYPTLTIIADCCHAQAVRYPIIVNHLASMISPYLPPPFSNYLHSQLLQIVVMSKQPDSQWSRTIWLVWFHHTYHRLLVIILHSQLLQIVVTPKLSGTQLLWTISLVWFHHTYHRLLVIIYTHNYCRLLSCPNSQIPGDCELSNWPDSTNSTLSYKCWDILAPFITLCFSHKIVSFLSVLIGFKQPDSLWSRNIRLATFHKLYITL